MKKAEYQRRRRELVDQLSAAEANVEVIRRRLDAIDVVWNEVINATDAGQSNIDANGEEDALGSLPIRALIDEAIENIGSDFNVAAVNDAIAATHPELGMEPLKRSTISGLLSSYVQDGRLELVVEGRGRRPSVFRRKPEAA